MILLVDLKIPLAWLGVLFSAEQNGMGDGDGFLYD